MKRIFDFFLALFIASLLIIPFLIIAIVILITSNGGVLHWSKRVGKDNNIFKMPKFRSMLVETPVVAKHLLKNPETYFSPIGKFLRRNSIDEFPQLFSILKGDMSFVGPRPALFNQKDLIYLRKIKGVHKLKPGLTGWAQVNGRDKLSVCDKVAYDVEYLNRQSFLFDFKILCMTFLKVIKRDDINRKQF